MTTSITSGHDRRAGHQQHMHQQQPHEAASKPDEGTYDMNDEECTDHSNLGSIAASVTSGSNNENCNSLKNLSVSENELSKEGGVSWSDTDGSTYVSENEFKGAASLSSNTNEKFHRPREQIQIRHQSDVEKDINADRKAECSSKDETFQDMDMMGKKTDRKTGPRQRNFKPPRPARSSHNDYNAKAQVPTILGNSVSEQCLRRRKREQKVILENVDYYSEVEVASTNDELSETCFLSREATRSIFCRRLIPLEIQRKPRDEDLSTLSSLKAGSVMPTGDAFSVNAVHTKVGAFATKGRNRKSATTKLQNVDYFSSIDVASNNNDVSTVDYRLSEKIAASAFEDKAGRPTDVLVVEGSRDQFTSLDPCCGPFVELYCDQGLKSMSTLGSSSVASNICDISSDSVGEASTLTGAAGTSPQILQETPTPDRNTSEATTLQNYSPSTDRRIQNLKEKIRKMQIASTLALLPDQQQPLSPNQSFPEFKISKERNLVGKSSVAGQSNKDATTRYPDERLGSDTKKDIHAEGQDCLAPQQGGVGKIKCALGTSNHMGGTRMKSSFGQGQVPSEVTPVVDNLDDVSTIVCDFDHSKEKEFVDAEEGFCPMAKSKTWRQKSCGTRSAEANLKAATQKMYQSMLNSEFCHGIWIKVMDLWSKVMDGRTSTEQAIIIVIFVSFIVLFILLISLVAK